MQFGEVDSDVGQFQQVLDFFTVWIFDWDLWIQSSEDYLFDKKKEKHATLIICILPCKKENT